MTTTTPNPPPANWFPDPSGSGQFRYWDGVGWTMHLSPTPLPDGRPPVWDDPSPRPADVHPREAVSNTLSHTAMAVGALPLFYQPLTRSVLLILLFHPIVLGPIAMVLASKAGKYDEPRAGWAQGVVISGVFGGLFFGPVLTTAIRLAV
jgi:hypothetical protein